MNTLGFNTISDELAEEMVTQCDILHAAWDEISCANYHLAREIGHEMRQIWATFSADGCKHPIWYFRSGDYNCKYCNICRWERPATGRVIDFDADEV